MQVQPDLEALDTSLDEEEDDSEELEKKSADKLGKLHFKLEYDFNKSEVRSSYNDYDNNHPGTLNYYVASLERNRHFSVLEGVVTKLMTLLDQFVWFLVRLHIIKIIEFYAGLKTKI